MPSSTRIIAFASGKGGAGKTTLAVNIGLALASMGQKVCLLDADLGLSNVDLLLGLETPEATLEDVLFNGISMEDVLVSVVPNLDIIPGSSGISRMAELPQEKRGALVDEFSKLDGYDFLLIDNSPGLSSQVVSLCLSARELIIVINPEVTSLVDAYALIKVLRENGLWATPRILVNRAENIADARKIFATLCTTVEKFLSMRCSWLGAIPLDPKARTSFNHRPVFTAHPNAPAARCIRFVADRLLKQEAKVWKNIKTEDFWESTLTRIKQRPRFDLEISGETSDEELNSWAEMSAAELGTLLRQKVQEIQTLCGHLIRLPESGEIGADVSKTIQSLQKLTRPLEFSSGNKGDEKRRGAEEQNVLVISNQWEMREVLQEMLVLLGYKAYCVSPVSENSAQARDAFPSLALVNCDRPEENICRILGDIPEVPLVLLGQYGRSRLLQNYAERIAAVIPPPVSLASLKATLKSLLA